MDKNRSKKKKILLLFGRVKKWKEINKSYEKYFYIN